MKGIIIIPGLGCNPNWYKGISKKTSKLFTTIILDWFSSNAKTIKDIVKLIEHARNKNNITKCFLIGHSLGGIFTFIYQYYYPKNTLGLYIIDSHFVNNIPNKKSKEEMKKIINGTVLNGKYKNKIQKWYNKVDYIKFFNYLQITYKWLTKNKINIKNIIIYGTISTDEIIKKGHRVLDSKKLFVLSETAKKIIEYESNFNLLILSNTDHWTFMNKHKKQVFEHIIYFLQNNKNIYSGIILFK